MMEKLSIREALDIPKYHAVESESIENAPGTWNSKQIDIYESDTKIGSYVRMYPAYGERTFFPFEQDSKWYALFSASYTQTQLMSLPSCEIIGGEEKVKGEGFCPVEFYIPNYVKLTYKDDDDNPVYYDAEWDIDKEKHAPEKCDVEVHHFNFGFVAGCYWGDDWSWKIQHLDLSRASEGIITRSEKYGYVWLGHGLKLKDSVHVDMDGDDLEHYHVDLAIVKSYNKNKDYSKFKGFD